MFAASASPPGIQFQSRRVIFPSDRAGRGGAVFVLNYLMRILFIIPSFLPELGGAQRQCELVGRELVDRGHTVVVLTRRAPGAPRRESIGGMAIQRVFPFSVRGRLHSPVMILTTVAWLLRHGRSFDVVQSFRLCVHNVAVALLRPLFGWRWLARMSGGGLSGDLAPVPPGLRKRLLRVALNRADVLLALSNDMRREMIAFGLDSGRIRITPNAVDAARFACPDRDYRRVERLLFSGRLAPEKNLRAVLEALTAPGLETCSLTLAGDGPERGALAEFARGLGIADRVVFRGEVGAENMPRLYCGHDLFVLPSLAEGMSNALLEAMAAGMVCACTPVGGAPDIIESGVNGLLAGGPSAAAVAHALNAAARAAAEQRADWGRNAAAMVRRRYDVSRVVDLLENLYAGRAMPPESLDSRE